jgi:aerobic-type carbon monoxide dehydrogenase small subunit (CoxS/CutS family)
MNDSSARGERRIVHCTINGRSVSAPAADRCTLGDFIRHSVGLTGTHYGCEHGVCGACTVIVDGLAQRSCLQFAVQVSGKSITTVEGLAQADGTLGVLQAAFKERRALQCGFCTPGILTTLTQFLRDVPSPDEEELRDALSGNICRCTGYVPILEAAQLAAARLRGDPDPVFEDAHAAAQSEAAHNAADVAAPPKESDYAF